jgi:hypothetical protein
MYLSLKVHKNEIFLDARFSKKQFLIGPFWGEVGLFRVVLRLRGINNVFNLGHLKKNHIWPLYIC